MTYKICKQLKTHTTTIIEERRKLFYELYSRLVIKERKRT